MDNQSAAIINLMSTIRTSEQVVRAIEVIAKNVLGHKIWMSEKQVKFYASSRESNYRQFEIPKKSGGVRTISAPCKKLKAIQECLNLMMKVYYEPSKNAFGFIPGRSVADNARYHIGQRFVFNIDLKDFFPSIGKRRILHCLTSEPFYFSQEVATLIAGLSCMGDKYGKNAVLPQGSPASPVLSNIASARLDYKLNKLANRFGARYSRYADDITFSSMNNIYDLEGDFVKQVYSIVAAEGFIINQEKVRLNGKNERREITGLTVTDKINVSRKYVKNLRAIINNWEKMGYKRAYSIFLTKYNAERIGLRGTPDMENVIAGKLDYLKMIKGADDSTYVKLADRFEALRKGSVVDKSFYQVLDAWEKDGIDAAIQSFENRSDNQAPDNLELLQHNHLLKTIESYSIAEFRAKFGVSVSFKIVNGRNRAFFDGKPSFHSSPVYVTNGIDFTDPHFHFSLVEDWKGKRFWLTSVKEIRVNSKRDVKLNKIHFDVKPEEHQNEDAVVSRNRRTVVPQNLSQDNETAFIKALSALSKDKQREKPLGSTINLDHILWGRRNDNIKEFCMSYMMSPAHHILKGIDMLYPDDCSFCVASCLIQDCVGNEKRVVILPRYVITKKEIEALKSYEDDGFVVEDIIIRIARMDRQSSFGRPHWHTLLFGRGKPSITLSSVEHSRFEADIDDINFDAPIAKSLSDCYIIP